MSIRNKLKTAVDKTGEFYDKHEGTIKFYVGYAVGVTVTYVAYRILTEASKAETEAAWDNYELKAHEHYGETTIPLKARNGAICYFTPNEETGGATISIPDNWSVNQ